MRRLLVVVAAVIGFATQALGQGGEAIQADVSAREIAIESNFTGHRVVVFGAVENYPPAATPSRLYDVLVVIRGPDEELVAWRKRRTLGIWLNRDGRLFRSVPGFYATLATRPIDQIAARPILAENGIGFANLDFGDKPSGVTPSRENAFRAALVRLMARENLYQSHRYGVNFVSGGLFRASLDLPANVPIGDYRADVFLFRDGRLIARTDSHFTIGKAGLERLVTRLSTDDPFVYGVVAVLLAFGIGLTAAFLARE